MAEPAGSEPETEPGPDTGPDTEPELKPETKAEAESETEPASEPRARTLTRGRLAGAAAVVVAVGAACALVLSGSSPSSGSAAPGSATPTTPAVNPQASYPDAAIASPFATNVSPQATATGTGVKTSYRPLTDDALRAAVPGCGSCKLVTRANGFSPDGAVLALFRTGAPVEGKSNFKLVVVGADGTLVWSAPDGVKALTAGIERFSADKAGNFYLALPGAQTGQILIVLTWKDGHVVDIGDLANPKIASDSVVGVMPEPTPGATATLVSQTRNGVSDADTGGLIESQYQIRNGVPVLIGCRRHVGESGVWIPFQPGANGCVDAPPGPVGPSDGDETTGGP